MCRAGRPGAPARRPTTSSAVAPASTDGPYKANLGPHALLASAVRCGRGWASAGCSRPYARPPLSGVRFRWQRRHPPGAGGRRRGRGAAAARPRGAGRSGLPARGRLTASAPRRPTRWRAAPGSSPTTTIPASCRPRSCGSRSCAGCCRRRRRRGSRSEAGRGSSIGCAPGRSGSASGSRPALGSTSLPEAPVIVATELADARRAAARRVADLAERQGGMHRSRARASPGRPVRSRRPPGDRLGGALHRVRQVARPGRRGADPGADADPARASPASRRPRGSSSCWTPRSRAGATEHLAPASGDGRPHRRPRPPRQDVARSPRGRPRRRRIPGRRHGRRARAACRRSRGAARSRPAGSRSLAAGGDKRAEPRATAIVG